MADSLSPYYKDFSTECEQIAMWCEMLTEVKNQIGIFIKISSKQNDFVNEFTGCEIANRRMSIKVLQTHKYELNIRLSALNQLYYSMKHSKKFNEKSYENKMLQRQINMVKQDIQTVKEMIEEERNSLKSYIDAKDDFYKKVRVKREKND